MLFCFWNQACRATLEAQLCPRPTLGLAHNLEPRVSWQQRHRFLVLLVPVASATMPHIRNWTGGAGVKIGALVGVNLCMFLNEMLTPLRDRILA